ncbi:GntR family transcriptional regulator [Vampirovibrio sp.]|uniref:GntR family transcriptional regulator n=1 Tax=Vampirovibrio sp. TaxID=2717857 RepID=UPI0035937BF7
MDISIQKGTSVSIHEQLVTQISMQIAAGILGANFKLPSIRALSKKLGIHHNTCLNAYRELENMGLIQIRHGSGARVASNNPERGLNERNNKDGAPMPLDQLADFFVQQVIRQDYRWEDALAALEKSRQAKSAQFRQPLVFVDIHADILPIFQIELQQALNRPVQIMLLNNLDLDQEQDAHFVVSRYHFQALKDKLQASLIFPAGNGHDPANHLYFTDRITVVDVGAVRQELELIKQLPSEALIAVISKSTIILQQAEAVIKALRGEDVYIRTILAGHESIQELQRVIKRAQATFTDWLCLDDLKVLTTKTLHPIRTIPQREIDKLKPFQG